MSPSQEPQRTFFTFGNPFRMLSPKGSLSSNHLDLLNTFEDTLTARLRNLKPAKQEDTLSLEWMQNATCSLCETHADIKVLITALDLPVRDWDEKWIDLYLANTINLLDTCLAFTSEISRLRRAHLHLTCALHELRGASPKKLMEARSSLDGWRHFLVAKNPRIDGCFSVMKGLVKTHYVPKIKNFPKGKVLTRAMFGVEALTLFVCSTFVAAFSGSREKLIDLRVSEVFSWTEAFSDLQSFVNAGIREGYSRGMFRVLREVDDLYSVVNKLYPIVEDGVRESAEGETNLVEIVSDLEKSDEKLHLGLTELAKEVDGFFKVILSARDALLCNLRFVGDDGSGELRSMGDVQGQAVR